jgi:hypothetical protein
MSREVTPPSKGLQAARSRRAHREQVPVEPKPHRWPILLVLPLLVAVGIGLQRHQDDKPAAVETASAAGLLPTAAAPGALSSTWYCAGGTATGAASGAAEETVQIANESDVALTGRLTVMPSAGDAVVKDLQLPAHSRTDVVVSSVVKAPYAGVVVEVDGGQVAVSHLLEGPTGRSVAACSSSPSASWYMPSGTTRPGTTQQLALFNPFPSEAVVSITFEADDGARSPQDYQAIVIPGQRITVLDISAKVTLRAELATTVTVRSGRVIVDQIQTADGTQQTTKSLTVTPAAPHAMPTWWFADGPAGEGSKTVFAVQNPSNATADVELQIRLDDVATYGEVEPFDVSVPAGRYVVIDVSGDGRVPPGAGYTAVAQSRNGVPIVADRVVTYGVPAVTAGSTVTLGSPVLASRWLVPAASLTSAPTSTVIVTNPSSTLSVSVTLSTVTAGKATPVPAMTDLKVPPGGRVGLDVPSGPGDAQVSVDVVASSVVVVESRLEFEKSGLAAALAVPVQGTIEVASTALTTSAPTTEVTTEITIESTTAGSAPATTPPTSSSSTASTPASVSTTTTAKTGG